VMSRIDQEIDRGFLIGSITIEGEKTFKIEFQNEYLVVLDKDLQPLHTTPDIIALLESESLAPLSSDQIRYGGDVDLIVAACPSIWRTEAGLSITSPEAFGYSFSPILIQEKV
jgi:DUF917 family protein